MYIFRASDEYTVDKLLKRLGRRGRFRLKWGSGIVENLVESVYNFVYILCKFYLGHKIAAYFALFH